MKNTLTCFFILFYMQIFKCLFFLLDPEYKRFLENYSCDEEKSMANPETLLGEIEAKTRELIGKYANFLTAHIAKLVIDIL